MKKTARILLPLFTLLALMLPSCSGNSGADAGDLLGTIPSDASLVVVMNAKSVLEKAGCKVSGDKIEPGKEFQALIDRNIKEGDREKIARALNGGTGIDPSVMAVYQVGYYLYFTGYLSDPAKFKAAVEKNLEATFSTEEGIDICQNVAVSNSRFWVNMQQGSIDPREVKHFTALDQTQSFLSNDYASNLTEFSADVEGWGNINGLMNTANFGFQERATLQVAVQTLYEDPSALAFTIDFEKGKARFDLTVLNAKGKAAKFQLPTQTVDVNALATMGGKTDALIALAVPNKLIDKLTKEMNSKGPSVYGEYIKMVQGIDGTIGLALGQGGAMRGFVTTNGQDFSNLSSLLGEFGLNVTKDGKVLRFTKGDVTGNGDIATLSKELKDAMLGIAYTDLPKNAILNVKLPMAVVKLVPEDGTMRLKATATSANENENFLISLINEM